MCVCISVRICVSVYAYVHLCLYVCVSVCVYMYLYVSLIIPASQGHYGQVAGFKSSWQGGSCGLSQGHKLPLTCVSQGCCPDIQDLIPD